MIVTLPLRLLSEANTRGHWAVRAKRVRAQRGLVRLVLTAKQTKPPSAPLTVTITRLGPGMLDGDNLVSSCKAVRDGVADYLGIDDGSPLVTWHYRQARERLWACRVDVEKRTA
jgi:hypothetical protein